MSNIHYFDEDNEPSHLTHKICQTILTQFSRICGVDLGRDLTTGRTRGSFKDEFDKIGTLARCILLIYVVFNVRLLANVYFQFLYDTRLLQLERIADSRTANQSMEELELRLRSDKEYYGETLRKIGAPWRDALNRYTFSTGYILVCTVAFIVYLNAMIFFRFHQPMNLYFVRMILDKKSEKVNCDRMIKDEIDCFEVSCWNYLRSLKSCSRMKDRSLDGEQMTALVFGVPSKNYSFVDRDKSFLDKMAENNLGLIEHLKKLAAAGRLYPINRSPEWVGRMTFMFVQSSLSNLIYSVVFDVTLVSAPMIFKLPMNTGPMDLLSIFELLFVAEMSVISLTFYLSVFIASSLDQFKYIKEVRKQMEECMSANKKSFRSINKKIRLGDQRGAQTTLDQMNLELALALIQYRIFLAQGKPLKVPFKFITASAVAAAWIIPVMVRAHIPYVTETIRGFITYFCSTVLVFGDLCMLSIAYLHYLNTLLYKGLYSLAAHSNQIIEMSGRNMVLDWSTVASVCKELHHPELLANKFVTDCFGFAVTYGNLLTVHYWFSIIVISFYFEIKSWNDLVGDRAKDPFGIYADLKLSEHNSNSTSLKYQ